MSVELTYPHIVKPEGAPAHLQRTPRVRVAQLVMDHLANGWSADEMVRQHSYLTLSEAHAALLYYFDHQDEIDVEIAVELKSCDDASDVAKSPFFKRMKTLGRL